MAASHTLRCLSQLAAESNHLLIVDCNTHSQAQAQAHRYFDFTRMSDKMKNEQYAHTRCIDGIKYELNTCMAVAFATHCVFNNAGIWQKVKLKMSEKCFFTWQRERSILFNF